MEATQEGLQAGQWQGDPHLGDRERGKVGKRTNRCRGSRGLAEPRLVGRRFQSNEKDRYTGYGWGRGMGTAQEHHRSPHPHREQADPIADKPIPIMGWIETTANSKSVQAEPFGSLAANVLPPTSDTVSFLYHANGPERSWVVASVHYDSSFAGAGQKSVCNSEMAWPCAG